MTEDLLKEATRALREEADDAQGSDLTRARVMLSLHAAKRKRRGRLAFGVPLVAVFVAGAAAAQISGALPRAIDRVVEVLSSDEPESAPTEPAKPGAGRAAVSSTASEPDPVPPPEETDPAAEPQEFAEAEGAELDEYRGGVEPQRPTPPSKSASAAAVQREPAKIDPGGAPPRAPATSRAAAKPEAASEVEGAARSGAAADPEATASARLPSDPSHRRYLEAHQAHFGAHDYARAITLWERYLHEFPRGRFAAEAQYNRALCLVRLGRSGEAKQALEPFASGRYGGYRQTEAQALIKALGG